MKNLLTNSLRYVIIILTIGVAVFVCPKLAMSRAWSANRISYGRPKVAFIFGGVMRTYCKHGHEWTRENIYINTRGGEECRHCKNISKKKSLKKYLQTHPWYYNFHAAQERCHNKKHRKYPRYGGRGIKFLMAKGDFKFLWFRDKAYLMKKASIDRIDNNGNYTVDNCRFIELSKNSKLGALQRHINNKRKDGE